MFSEGAPTVRDTLNAIRPMGWGLGVRFKGKAFNSSTDPEFPCSPDAMTGGIATVETTSG